MPIVVDQTTESGAAPREIPAPAFKSEEQDSETVVSTPSAPPKENAGSRWLNRALRRSLQEERGQAPTEGEVEKTEQAPNPKATATRERPGAGRAAATVPEDKSEQAPSSSDEEVERRIQSEADKRQARFIQKWVQDHPETKTAEEKTDESSSTDVVKAFQEAHRTTMEQYDRGLLDPLYAAIDPVEAAKIVEKHAGLAKEPVKQRIAIFQDLRSAYENRMEKDIAEKTEAKLRKNPAFIKKVLADNRGEIEEPDVISDAGAVAQGADMNNFMRTAIGRGTSRFARTR